MNTCIMWDSLVRSQKYKEIKWFSSKKHLKLTCMLYILEKKLGLQPFWLNFQSNFESKIENQRFYQKGANLKSDKSGLGNLMRSTAPKNLLKHPLDLKMVPVWSVMNLLVYGQLYCLIAMFLKVQWHPPQKNFDIATTTKREKERFVSISIIYGPDLVFLIFRHLSFQSTNLKEGRKMP